MRDLFKPYGHIKSLVLQKNEIGYFGFVCFDDPGDKNKEYGPLCAARAIDALQNKEVEGDNRLYLRHAMKKIDRQLEKVNLSIRYKNSKKRNNLYVKNLPPSWTESNLKDLFSPFGELEHIRLDKTKQIGTSFAFICYKQHDAAAVAK